MSVKVKIKKLDENAVIPKYQSAGAAGFDLHAIGGEPYNSYDNSVQTGYLIYPGKTKLVPTGLSVEIPEGYELQIRPRSGLAAKNSITVLNSPGTVDSDYRGEIKVILYNAGQDAYWIKTGDRIAQGVVAPVVQAEFEETEELSETERSSGGFGSSGK